MLPQALIYSLLLALPLLSESLPLPKGQRSLANKFARRDANRQKRIAVRDLSDQQKNAVRSLNVLNSTPPPTTYTAAPIVWTSNSAISPPSTLSFFAVATSSSSITTATYSTTALPTLAASVSMQVIAIPAPQLITYTYVAPTRSTTLAASTTSTIIFATISSTSDSFTIEANATPTSAYIKLGSSIFAISSTVVAFEPNFAILSTIAVAPTPTPSPSAAIITYIGTKTFSVASQVAVGPHSFSGPTGPSATMSLTPAEQLQNAAESATTTLDLVSATPTSTGSSIAPISLGSLDLTASHAGSLTYYTPSNNLTACNLSSPPTTSFVLSSSLFSTFPNSTSNPNLNPICGQSVSLVLGSHTLVGTVGDSCDDCSMWDIGISQALFNGLENAADGRAQVEWSFVST